MGARPQLAPDGNWWQATAAKSGVKQEDAIAALLTQRNLDDAARACGLGARTLILWLKLPEFNTFYPEAKRATILNSRGLTRAAVVSGGSNRWRE